MKNGEEKGLHELQGLILQWAVNRLLELCKQDRVYWGNFDKDGNCNTSTLADFEDFANIMSDTDVDFLKHLLISLDREKGIIGWTLNGRPGK